MFAFAAAKHLQVDAYEIEQSAVDALIKAAAAAKGRRPIAAFRRDLAREPLSFMELKPYAAVIVDPPRAGADLQAKALAKSKVALIVMVSCNPGTFARDIKTLLDGGYHLKSVVPVDQFLFTAHTEVVAVLDRG